MYKRQIEYVNGKPSKIQNVVISAQHAEDVSHEQIREDVISQIINPILPDEMVVDTTEFLVNPTGTFVIGGPMGDTGLTGRKIIVDTYGGYSRHGGGAFSGKDPSKVDRSAAYMARYIAKNIVAADIASKAEVQIAYAIGVAEPVSVLVDVFGTSEIEEDLITNAVKEVFSLKPKEIIDTLNLRRPIYKNTAAYGHFGRSEDEFSWEKTDKAQDLRTALKI